MKNRRHLINMVCLLILWVVSAFNYFLINFQLKYIEGDIYTNTIISSVSEVTAYIISGALYQRLGAKIPFIGCFLISIIGSLIYVNLG